MQSSTTPSEAFKPAPLPLAAVARPEFLAVYEELFPFVWRVARRLGVAENAVDDVCQEVFLVVHRRLPEFEGRSSLKTWVYGILQNIVLVHRRTAKRKDRDRAAVDPDQLVDRGPTPHDAASTAETARIGHELLAELDDDRRAMFVLVDLEGLSVVDAAEATQLNLNTAYGRLRAARADFAAAVTRFHARNRGK